MNSRTLFRQFTIYGHFVGPITNHRIFEFDPQSRFTDVLEPRSGYIRRADMVSLEYVSRTLLITLTVIRIMPGLCDTLAWWPVTGVIGIYHLGK